MGKLLGASWLPKVFGFLGLLFSGLSALPVMPTDLVGYLQAIAISLFGSGLFTVKQSNVTNSPIPLPVATPVEPVP